MKLTLVLPVFFIFMTIIGVQSNPIEPLQSPFTAEEEAFIKEVISKNLINRLKNTYAVTTRSRYGRSIIDASYDLYNYLFNT